MKIKYLKHYNGIQPGTVVDEPNATVVAKLTKEDFVLGEKGERIPIPPFARPTDEPTTAEREIAAAKAAAPRRETVKA